MMLHDPAHDPDVGRDRPGAGFLLLPARWRRSPFLLIGVWVCFIVIEVSDLLDGHFCRMFEAETELGKVLDPPFADSLSRLTYFVALAGSAILPLSVLLILIYRDMAVAFAGFDLPVRRS